MVATYTTTTTVVVLLQQQQGQYQQEGSGSNKKVSINSFIKMFPFHIVHDKVPDQYHTTFAPGEHDLGLVQRVPGKDAGPWVRGKCVMMGTCRTVK